jgi:hypothetical protein
MVQVMLGQLVEVYTVELGEAALEAVTTGAYAVVLLDMAGLRNRTLFSASSSTRVASRRAWSRSNVTRLPDRAIWVGK